jgi:glycosyltransferase involved in cell wall biosynthesis
MPEKLPISAHVLTWNSAQTLEKALASVARCAEILVIDGGSTDATLEIAEKHGARAVPQRFPGAQGRPLSDFAAARNVGLKNSTQPWVLALDSDEEMSPAAMEELANVTKTSTEPTACLVPRRYVLGDGSVVKFASTYPNERLYFFRTDAVTEWEKPVHERIALKPGTIVRRLEHGSLAPLPPIGAFHSKLSQYARIEGERSIGMGWAAWFKRVWHTLRGRAVATVRILWIWLIPRPGKRLPLKYEIARYWYSWRLLIETFPLTARKKPQAS